MAGTYSYDPSKIDSGDFNQIRFELGDTDTDGGKKTCAFCDEEYAALINKAVNGGRSWNYAKLLCVRALCNKYAHAVTNSISGMTWNLSDLYPRWKAIREELEKSMQYPMADPQALGVGSPDGGHYFRLGLGENPRTMNGVGPFGNPHKLF